MKILYKRKIFSLLLIIAIALIFTTCKKDTDCVAKITVKKQSDTLIIVPRANVTIKHGDIKAEGVTDENGEFSYTFKLEAILDVEAKLYTPSDTLIGFSIIRLEPGETVRKTVFIE